MFLGWQPCVIYIWCRVHGLLITQEYQKGIWGVCVQSDSWHGSNSFLQMSCSRSSNQAVSPVTDLAHLWGPLAYFFHRYTTELILFEEYYCIIVKMFLGCLCIVKLFSWCKYFNDVWIRQSMRQLSTTRKTHETIEQHKTEPWDKWATRDRIMRQLSKTRQNKETIEQDKTEPWGNWATQDRTKRQLCHGCLVMLLSHRVWWCLFHDQGCLI